LTRKGSNGKTGRPARAPDDKPTREKILEAAIDLFAEQGYDGTSMRDIARAVGIRESAIYKHYAGKDAILQMIFAYAEAHIYAPLPLAQNATGPDQSSIFRDMLEGLPKIIMSDPTLIKITRIMLTQMHHDSKVNKYVQDMYGERAHMYTEALFKKQMEEGKIRPCDTRALSMIFNGFRFSWVYWTFIANNPSPGDIGQAEKDLQASIMLFEDFLKP